MFWLVQILVPIAVIMVPVLIVWIVFRASTNKDNRNAEIIIKAIENNSSIDADKLAEALGKRQRTPLQVLQLRLLRGCIFTFAGIGAGIIAAIISYNLSEKNDIIYFPIVVSALCLTIGTAYLVVYFVSRKSIRKEEKCDD